MKIAIQLHGIIGGTHGKRGAGENDPILRFGHYHLKNYVLKYNDCDVFCHSASTDFEHKIQDYYKPVASLFEKQREFNVPENSFVGDNKARVQAHYHRWYSFKKVNDLRKEYEKATGIKYDGVYCGRYDLAWRTPVRFDEFDLDKFTVGNWNQFFYTDESGTKQPLQERDWYCLTYHNRQVSKLLIANNDISHLQGYDFETKLAGYPHTDEGLLDLWSFSSPENANKFATLYDHLDSYNTRKPNVWNNGASTIHDHIGNITSHRLVPCHLEEIGLLDKINFKYYLHDDFPVVRRMYFAS